MRIDTHQHFWRYNDAEYDWMGKEHATIKRDFLPENLEPLISQARVDGSIAVQARQTLQETTWLLQLAEQHSFIRGVVGWLPLQKPNIDEMLESIGSNPKLVGVRHVIHDETDDDFILRSDFNEGISKLVTRNLVYDILIFGKHLPQTLSFVDNHPSIQFVVDHIAKPTINPSSFDAEWQKGMLELAKRPHVSCKISGMTTEVSGLQWNLDTLRPYFDTVLRGFGPRRLMFGSDWPVCLLKIEYQNWLEMVEAFIHPLSQDEQSAIMGTNAERIYQLSESPEK